MDQFAGTTVLLALIAYTGIVVYLLSKGSLTGEGLSLARLIVLGLVLVALVAISGAQPSISIVIYGSLSLLGRG